MKNTFITLTMLLFSLLSADLLSQANIAMGTSSATGQSSFAAGDSSEAIGGTSLAMGNKAKAIGEFSLSLGDQTRATGKWAQAFGFGSHAEGDYSFASGFFNRAWTFGVAIGAANNAATDGAVAIGRNNNSFGISSSVMGTWSTARTYGETVLGAYSEDYTPIAPDGYQWEPEDRLFVIANGHGDGAGNGRYSNALTMLKNGDTDMVGHLKLDKTLTVGEDTLQTEFNEGQIRYNQDTRDIEGYAQNQWTSLTGLGAQSVADIGSWDVITEGATESDNNFKSNTSDIVQFLYTPGANGEETGFAGETEDLVMASQEAIEVLAFDWSISNDIEFIGNTIDNFDKAKFGTATVLMSMNTGAIQLMDRSANGILIDDIILQQRERTPPTATDINSFLSKVEMKTVAVESVEYYMSEGGSRELVRVTLRFGALRVTNQDRNDQATLVQIGPIFTWNQLTNASTF